MICVVCRSGQPDDQTGDYRDRTENKGAGDGAGADHGDGCQGCARDEPVEQPGRGDAEAFDRHVPGQGHHGGDRDRQAGQRGQLGRGGLDARAGALQNAQWNVEDGEPAFGDEQRAIAEALVQAAS